MAAQIRRFVFFDKDVVKDPETREPFTGFQSLPLTCSTSGRGALVFGDSDGFVHEVDRSLQLTSFQAFEYGVTHLLQMRQNNLLIVAGNDEEGINPAVKVFNLDKVRCGTVCVHGCRVYVAVLCDAARALLGPPMTPSNSLLPSHFLARLAFLISPPLTPLTPLCATVFLLLSLLDCRLACMPRWTVAGPRS